MKWKNRRSSTNIEDQRYTQSTHRGRRRGKGSSLGMIAIALVAMYFGVDPRVALNLAENMSAPANTAPQSSQYNPPPQQDELAQMVSVVLADTEDTWHELFKQRGKQYQEPRLVLFTDSVRSSCGTASAAMGPFYCPGDNKVYIDLSFYRDLRQRHNAPGDFAQAYVIAHEVGHHVQNLLGISGKVHQKQRQMNKKQANALSVKLELQADCFAGVWAHHTDKNKHILEQGDVEEALNAASAIGDDRLQKQATGHVTPDSFTHGSSQQRVFWFKKGLLQGSFEGCNTFA